VRIAAPGGARINITRLPTAATIEPAKPATPTAPEATAKVAPPRRARWWLELLTIAWLCWLYDDVTELAPLRLHAALAHAHALLGFERSIGLDPEHALDRWLAPHHTLALLVSDYYDNAHFIVTLGLLGWLWWRRADIYRPLRSTLVLVNVLAFVVFWLYPVAPPRMLPGFTDVVAASGAFGSWHSGALASHANQLAAMPSLHIAWALWCTLAVWRMTRRALLRVLAAVYPCLTAVAVLATGNHYLLDVLAGALVLVLAAALVRAWGRIRSGPRARGGERRAPAAVVLDVRGARHKVVTKSPTG
jgi:PAP2 superfamily